MGMEYVLFGTFITLECEMIVLEHCIFESKITLKKSRISIMIRHKVKERLHMFHPRPPFQNTHLD